MPLLLTSLIHWGGSSVCVGFDNVAVTFIWGDVIGRCGGCGMMVGCVPLPDVPPVLADSVLAGVTGSW